MALSKDMLKLMRCVAENDIQKAKSFTKAILANEKAQSTRVEREHIQNLLSIKSNSLVQLPANVSGILTMEDTSTSFVEARYFIGITEEKAFNEIRRYHAVNSMLAEMGIDSINTSMLYGKSGTGKTMFGRYVSYKLGLPFVYINFSSTIDSLLGGTGKNISKAFEFVSKTPCVFMIDEIDAIGMKRGIDKEVGEMSRVTIGLMQAMDNLCGNTVVLAATNRLDIIDKALLRRFKRKYEFKYLQKSDFVAYAQKYFSGLRNFDDASLFINGIEKMDCQELAQSSFTDLMTNWLSNVLYNQLKTSEESIGG